MRMTGRRLAETEVIEPTGPQGLEPAPAVADADGDGEDIAEFAVEVAQVALRVMDHADGEVGEPGQPLGEQPHDDAFAGAGVALDQREATLTQVRLFDAPAEVLDLRRHVERLDRHLRGERVPFEAIEGPGVFGSYDIVLLGGG